jgi:superfamily II DNA or RNA helicase
MVTITYGTAYCTLTTGDLHEQIILRMDLHREFTLKVPGAYFSPAYQRGFWDGCEHFFSYKDGTFRTGMLARVLGYLKKSEWEVEVKGFPEAWPGWDTIPPVTLGDRVLYDHQMYTLRQILRYHRGIVKIATNGGKTDLWAAVVKVLQFPPSIFFIPRRAIFQQTVESFRERLEHDVGVIGEGKCEPNMEGVTVVMYHSLHKRIHDKTILRWMESCQAVAADECHMLSAQNYMECFEKTGGDFRVGMSGTPFNKDKEIDRAKLIGATGAVLADVSNTELIDKGISQRPNVLMVTPLVNDISLYKTDYRDAINRAEARHKVCAIFARAFVKKGMQTVIFVARTQHGLAIQEHIPEAVLATSATGNRREVMERLKRGDVFTCICTPIFDTGLSVDHIQGMINAAEGESEQTVLQRVGRTMRKKYEKNLWIVDFHDTFNKYTKSHSKSREAVYKSQEGFVQVENWRDAPLDSNDRYALLGLLA